MPTIPRLKGRQDVARPCNGGCTPISLALRALVSATSSATHAVSQGNLTTPLTGANTYSTITGPQSNRNHATSSGGASALGPTGSRVTGVSGSASSRSGPHVVSAHVVTGGNAVALTVLIGGHFGCWRSLGKELSLAPPLRWRDSSRDVLLGRQPLRTSSCLASSVTPTTISSTGFPHG